MTELARPIRTPQQLAQYADPERPYEGNPWDRQPRESHRAYEAFKLYLTMDPPRTATGVKPLYFAKFGKQANTSEWGRKHRWIERAEAYDNFTTAQLIAEQRRQRVRSATKHAQQAAAVQDVLMLPVEQLRKRIAEQGGELAVVNELGDAELLKLMRAMGGAGELAVAQRAEREALSSTGDVVVPRAELKVKGELVRKMLSNPTLRGLMEKVTIEATLPLEAGDQEEG